MDFVKDQELWHDDGNLILEAEGTGFRVYKGQLSRSSRVFSDMFGSQDMRADETSYDCPVVPTHVSAVDLRNFLRIVVGPCIDSLKQTLIPFPTLASIIRVAHKFLAEDILSAAASRLESFLIPNATHWLAAPTSWDERREFGQRQHGLVFDDHHAIELVNLIHLIDKPRMLPLALYLCSLADPLVLRNGAPRTNQPPATPREGDAQQIAGVEYERLSDEDYLACMRATQAITHESQTSLVRVLHDTSSRPCPMSRQCVAVLQTMLLALSLDSSGLAAGTRLAEWLVPLDKKTPLPSAYVQYAQRICAKCHERLVRRSEEECEAMRRRLPQFFGLDGEGWV